MKPKGLVQELFGDHARWSGLTAEQRKAYHIENRRRYWAAHPEKKVESRAKHAARLRERRLLDPTVGKRRAPYMRDYKIKRKAKIPDVNRRDMLRAKYGLTHGEYEAMFASQGGKCATCNRTKADSLRRHLCVDHNHSTGAVRALLCARCNMALGHAGDDPEFLRRLADYLELHNQRAYQQAQRRAG